MAYDISKWEQLYSPNTSFERSSFNVTELPEKYNVDLDKLDEGIASTLEKYPMISYPVPKQGISVPGYYGLCFKSKPGVENPCYEGVTSNSYFHDTTATDQIDLEYTEKAPSWFPYLDELESKFRGTVTQIRLIKLEAGYNLLSREQTAHLDYPWYRGVRLHICLTPGIEYKWRVLGVDHSFYRSNHIHFLDAGKPHGAINDHNSVDRYVLNINVAPKLDLHIDEQIRQGLL